MEKKELQAWICLSNVSGVGPSLFRKLLTKYDSASQALNALPEIYKHYKRPPPDIPTPEYALEQLELAEKHGVTIITLMDSEYPTLLNTLSTTPPLLYTKGNLNLLYTNSLAVVGSRQASLNGTKFTKSLCRDLGKEGITIVSGLATGIDAAAHEGGLDTGTIAVLGNGLDINYPEDNLSLQNEIATKGLLVTEFPFKTPPSAHHFPQRNRIISALSLGTLVVEAKYQSGSMITARNALDLGRDVFAIPGFPYDPRAEGPNQLLSEGAILVRSAQDILNNLTDTPSKNFLEEFNPKDYFPDPGPEAKNLSEMREKILSLLSSSPTSIEEIIEATGFPHGYVWEIILDLDLSDKIQRHPHNKISLET